MPKALIFCYMNSGIPSYPNRITEATSRYPIKEIYFPEYGIFLEHNKEFYLPRGPFVKSHSVYKGSIAEKKYHKLIENLKKIFPNYESPDETDVSEIVIDWVEAMYNASNPPKEISDLFDF